MPLDEKLVFSVYYKNTKKGSSELTIKDSSAYSTYQFSFFRQNPFATINNFANIEQGTAYNLWLKPDTYRENTKLYYVVKNNNDNKIIFVGDAPIGDPSYNPNEGVTTVDANSKYASIRFITNYFPSVDGYGATLEIYHDAEKKFPLISIPINTSKINFTNLDMVSKRFIDGKTTSKTIYAGDEVYIIGQLIGNYYIFRYPASLSVNNSPFDGSNPFQAGYFTNDVMTGTSVLPDYNFFTIAYTKPTDITNDVPIVFKMGDITFGKQLEPNLKNSMIDMKYGWVSGQVTYPDIQKFTSNPGLQIAIGSSGFNQATVNRLTNSSNNIDLTITPYTSSDGSRYTGWLSALTYDTEKLNNAKWALRQQFGRLQKLFRLNQGSVTTITKSMLQDSVAEAAYGVVPNLNSRELVFLFTPESGPSNGSRIILNEDSAYFKMVGGSGAPVNVMVLRGFSKPDESLGNVPYPRIVAAGYTGAGATVVAGGEGIDCRDNKYMLIANVVANNDNDFSVSNMSNLYIADRRWDGFYIEPRTDRRSSLAYAIVQLYA